MANEPDIVARLERRRDRVHIALGVVCNNNCLFCMEEDREGRARANAEMTAERVRWILDEHRGAEEVCFTSGEPTTRADLPDLVHAARAAGYRRISMMTNGRRLAQPGYAAALARLGMNRFYVSIHGPTARLHEGLTRTPGSFAQTVAGLDAVAALRPFGVELHTSTVVTKRNVDVFLELYRFLRGHGVEQVVLNVMQAQGGADTHFDQVFPRYREIAARFRAFLDAAGEARPPAFLVDIPLCTTEGIPDFNRGYVERHFHYETADRAITTNPDGRADPDAPRDLVRVARADIDDSFRAKRPECAACRYDRQCEGVWRNYTRRYGWDELVPISG